MKRFLLVCGIGLVATLLAAPAGARGILADWGSIYAACNMNTGGPALLTVGTGALASDFSPNVGVAFSTECDLAVAATDQVDNATDSLAMYLYGPLSDLAAQVIDYKLSAGDVSANSVAIGGYTEIEFNYGGPCGSQTTGLTWGGVSYSALCSAANDTSLLFGSLGNLEGWLDNSDNETMGLTDSGWSISGTTTTVPEPGTLALFGFVFLPILLRLRRRDGNS